MGCPISKKIRDVRSQICQQDRLKTIHQEITLVYICRLILNDI